MGLQGAWARLYWTGTGRGAAWLISRAEIESYGFSEGAKAGRPA